jgi:hypothetical protein
MPPSFDPRKRFEGISMAAPTIPPLPSVGPGQALYRDFHSKEWKVQKRTPTEKLHDILPTDIVEIRSQKNADFKEGERVPVETLNPHSPNILRLVRESGESTHLPYTDLLLKEKVASRLKPGESVADIEELNRYLLWP